ncbi:GNAT family N-acetyltransferase [Pedobacter sp. Du54]|uniref:GNAT family N-acetyltransferase n=1 Tax=Pedobacter anseongensis TaxID=3133439 RepID=UPI003098DC43
MNHILDNPIYHALCTAHLAFSKGTPEATYYQEDIAPFAGLKENSKENFEALHENSPPESTFVVFTPKAYQTPKNWELVSHIDMFQLVYEPTQVPSGDEKPFEDLNESHVEEMIALVKLTQPGPFKSKTILLGNYTGVFRDEKLVSMAGHRFHPIPYIEISAVCTHPDHLGNGYAYILLREQIKRILAKNQIPFLHVRNDNVAAVKLYQKLGFVIRTEMFAYVLRKVG